MQRAEKTAQIRRFLVRNVENHSRGVGGRAAPEFGITRQAVHRHLRALRDEGLVKTLGERRGVTYTLPRLAEASQSLAVSPSLEEHVVWRDMAAPVVAPLPENVREICAYGFTEILNNAREHSRSPTVQISIERTAAKVKILIWDLGIG